MLGATQSRASIDAHNRDGIVKMDSGPAQTDSFSGVTLSTFEPVSEVMVKHVIMTSAPKTCSLDTIPDSTSVGIT